MRSRFEALCPARDAIRLLQKQDASYVTEGGVFCRNLGETRRRAHLDVYRTKNAQISVVGL